MKRITTEMLQDKEACRDQVKEFRKRFPNGVTFKDTKDAKRQCKAVASVFDWDWAARHLLNKPLWGEYWKARRPLYDEYLKAKRPLWDEYEKARQPLWDEYKKAEQPLWDEYKKASQPLYDEYEKARQPLWDEYKKARAVLFAKLYMEGTVDETYHY